MNKKVDLTRIQKNLPSVRFEHVSSKAPTKKVTLKQSPLEALLEKKFGKKSAEDLKQKLSPMEKEKSGKAAAKEIKPGLVPLKDEKSGEDDKSGKPRMIWEDRKVRSNILLLGESLGGKVFQVLLDDTLPMKDQVAVLESKLISIHQLRFGNMLITLLERTTTRERPNSAPYLRLNKTRKPLFLQLETSKALKKLKIEKNSEFFSKFF